MAESVFGCGPLNESLDDMIGSFASASLNKGKVEYFRGQGFFFSANSMGVKEFFLTAPRGYMCLVGMSQQFSLLNSPFVIAEEVQFSIATRCVSVTKFLSRSDSGDASVPREMPEAR